MTKSSFLLLLLLVSTLSLQDCEIAQKGFSCPTMPWAKGTLLQTFSLRSIPKSKHIIAHTPTISVTPTKLVLYTLKCTTTITTNSKSMSVSPILYRSAFSQRITRRYRTRVQIKLFDYEKQGNPGWMGKRKNAS